MSKTKPFGSNRCPNCGEYGSHFVPPSLGEPVYICKENKDWKSQQRCLFDHQHYIDMGMTYCPHCLDKFERENDPS